MHQLKIVSVNLSARKGTIKLPQPAIELSPEGVAGDAHAGLHTRQVSLLAIESIRDFETKLYRAIAPGEFAENITTEGFRLNILQPLDTLTSGNTMLEITQIGKKCHGTNCEIFRQTGDCVMPREGVFARVLAAGSLTAGAVFTVQQKVLTIELITLSDRAYAGVYEDRSGPLAKQLLAAHFASLNRQVTIDNLLLDDDAERLRNTVARSKADIILTTGGTGIGPRDNAPDTIAPMLDKQIPGIMELVRVSFGREKPNALLSRSIAGTRGRQLIYTLPGSTSGVKEYLEVIAPTLLHSVYMVNGLDIH